MHGFSCAAWVGFLVVLTPQGVAAERETDLFGLVMMTRIVPSRADNEERGDNPVVGDQGIQAEDVRVAVVVHVFVTKALAVVFRLYAAKRGFDGGKDLGKTGHGSRPGHVECGSEMPASRQTQRFTHVCGKPDGCEFPRDPGKSADSSRLVADLSFDECQHLPAKRLETPFDVPALHGLPPVLACRRSYPNMDRSRSTSEGVRLVTQPARKPGWLTPATDYGPLGLFLAAYLKYDLMVATAVLVLAALVAVALGYAIARHVPKMALVSAGLVLVFGGLTLILKDATFIKMKPTIVQLLFAIVLGGGVALGRSPLKFVMGGALDLHDDAWRRLSLRFAAFFAVMAALNELVWRTQEEEFWVFFKVFGLLGLTVLFAMAQTPFMMRHRREEAGE